MQYQPYACMPDQSRGRLYPEEESPTRTVFQRDLHRIIHSSAFRRMEYKTQVFVAHEGDHYRNRLTHSLEVAQIARSMARTLGVDEDLAETIALAHDLGHTPFGHAGEEILNELMQPHGSFDHNGHSIKLLTELEQSYASFDGLNLTWESLEGIAKHNGPLVKNVSYAIEKYNKTHNLELSGYASLEAQLAAIADDIAYNNHDMDDGLRAGLFTLKELSQLPMIGEVITAIAKNYPNLEASRHMHETIRHVIRMMIDDVIIQTQENLKQHNVKHLDDIRAASQAMVFFSPKMEEVHQALKSFLNKQMYQHSTVKTMTRKAKANLTILYSYFDAHPQELPVNWYKLVKEGTEHQAIVIADYIAGMTDRFAIKEAQRVGG